MSEIPQRQPAKREQLIASMEVQSESVKRDRAPLSRPEREALKRIREMLWDVIAR